LNNKPSRTAEIQRQSLQLVRKRYLAAIYMRTENEI